MGRDGGCSLKSEGLLPGRVGGCGEESSVSQDNLAVLGDVLEAYR